MSFAVRARPLSAAGCRRLRDWTARASNLTTDVQFNFGAPRELVKVPIVGRPNVGKSTLFNLIAERTRRRHARAIVSPHAGTTRDRREGRANLAGAAFVAVDTGGLEEESEEAAKAEKMQKASKGGGGAWLNARIQEQVASALQDADVAIFMVDAKEGVTTLDKHFAQWARRLGGATEWIVVVNKAERVMSLDDEEAMQDLHSEVLRLGLGSDVVFTSAKTGEGLAALTVALLPHIEHPEDAAAGVLQDHTTTPKPRRQPEGREEDEEEEEELGEVMRRDKAEERRVARGGGNGAPLTPDLVEMAIMGRPNVGKSSILNRLLGEDRVLVGPVPGLTRDAISVDWTWNGRRIRLVDTAGLRKAGKRDRSTELEELSAEASMDALRLASVVVLVLDAEEQQMRHSELSLAHMVVHEGRALVLVANKADRIADLSRQDLQANVLRQVEQLIPQQGSLPVVATSALTGAGVGEILPLVADARDRWCRRVNTGLLNRWLAAIERHHPPPSYQGQATKLKYITQLKGRPPTFVVWTNRPQSIVESFVAFLRNNLREEFDFHGVPIRIFVRSTSKKLKDRVKEQTQAQQQQQQQHNRPPETTVTIQPSAGGAKNKPKRTAKPNTKRAIQKKRDERRKKLKNTKIRK